MKNLFLVGLLAFFAIRTEQCGNYFHDEDEDVDNFHLRRRPGRPNNNNKPGGKGGKLSGLIKKIDGRALSRTGHAIDGTVRIADTIKGWAGGHLEEEDEEW